MNLKNRVDSELEDDDEHPKNQYLGYFVRGISVNEYTIHINEPIQMPEYYTNTVNVLSGCSKHDTVKFLINSPGGFLIGLFSLLDAIAKTEATTVAVLTGQCHSAASILALHCDYIEVGPYATSLCHNVRYGSSGKSSDIVDHVMHMSSVSEKLVRETYSGYLTEQEILDLLKGKEFYMESEEIVTRLQKREEYLAAQEALPVEEVEEVSVEETMETISKRKTKRLKKE
jgi:ATP-dependent protease ClpP protease subunit